ncbi:MAG: methyltransferase domain-containing protein [Verrucomicrobiota bacterium]
MAEPEFTPFQRLLLRLRGPGFTPAWCIHLALNALSPLAWLSARGWRGRTPPEQGWKLHLGCGPIYLPGWLNTELLPLWKKDCWIDLRHGLPFPDGSVRAVYANQVLEHFTHEDGTRLLANCHRVLRPGGALRLAVPDRFKAERAVVEKDREFFTCQLDLPPETSLRDAAAEYLLCGGHHLVQYDFALLRDTLRLAGDWDVIEEADPGSPRVLTNREKELSESRWPDIHRCCLVVEAVKAA